MTSLKIAGIPENFKQATIRSISGPAKHRVILQGSNPQCVLLLERTGHTLVFVRELFSRLQYNTVHPLTPVSIEPNGRRISYIRKGRNGSDELILMEIATRKIEVLSLVSEFTGGLNWSGDGASLIYSTSDVNQISVGAREPAKAGIVAVSLGGKRLFKADSLFSEAEKVDSALAIKNKVLPAMKLDGLSVVFGVVSTLDGRFTANKTRGSRILAELPGGKLLLQANAATGLTSWALKGSPNRGNPVTGVIVNSEIYCADSNLTPDKGIFKGTGSVFISIGSSE